MASEEQKLLINMIEQFAKTELENIAQKIEKEGLKRDLIKRLAELGLLAATTPQSEGGSGIDRKSFSLILMILAKYSPSVSYFTYLQNTLISELLLKSKDKKEEFLKIASGEAYGTIVHDLYLNFNQEITLNNSRLYGTNNYVTLPDAELHLVLSRSGSSSHLIITKPNSVTFRRPLGLRGLSFGAASYDEEIKDEQKVLNEAESFLQNHLFETADQIAAIAIGMSEAAIDKAIEYSKERKAFESYLYEFQPISAVLIEIKGKIEELKKALLLAESFQDKLSLKLNSLETARIASRVALQIHGGYGYLEDLGVERYYRDSMHLSILTSNYLKEIKALSRDIISPEAFKI